MKYFFSAVTDALGTFLVVVAAIQFERGDSFAAAAVLALVVHLVHWNLEGFN